MVHFVLPRMETTHKVNRIFVKKIKDELWTHHRILSPRELRTNQNYPVGPGSKSLSQIDIYIILMLHHEDPNTHLVVYRDYLKRYTGTVVSTDIISRLFLHGFPFRGSLVKPNLIPLDKFKPENEMRAYEYLKILFDLDPCKIIFVDEKHLKGEEIFRANRKVTLFG